MVYDPPPTVSARALELFDTQGERAMLHCIREWVTPQDAPQTTPETPGNQDTYRFSDGSEVLHKDENYVFIKTDHEHSGFDVRKGHAKPSQDPVRAGESNRVMPWPTTQTVWEAAMRKLQRDQGDAPAENHPALTRAEANTCAPHLNEALNAVCESYQPPDDIAAILDHEEGRIADAVVALIPHNEINDLLSAVSNATQD